MGTTTFGLLGRPRDHSHEGFPAFGVDVNQAAMAVDATCEQQSYGEYCYIPPGYCNLYQ